MYRTPKFILLLLTGLLAGCQPMASVAPTDAATPSPTATPPPPTVSLLRGPYLQLLTPDSVTVVWKTDLPAMGCVGYGRTAPNEQIACTDQPTDNPVVALTGLPAYTRIHYQILQERSPLAEPTTFRTAAPPTQNSYAFVVMGDTRSDLEAHRQVIDAILTRPPDFYLHTGDLVEDGNDPALWDQFFAAEGDLMRTSVIYPTLGNHEHESPIYYDIFHLPGNESWYSFDYGTAHIVVLQLDTNANVYPDSEQYAWLEADLAATRQPWKIVMEHVPPYSSGEHGSDLIIRRDLEPLLERYKVDVVFNGHDHIYERSAAHGITYIVTGGSGAPLYELSNSNPASQYAASVHHYIRITVNDNRMQLVAFHPGGAVLDQTEIVK